MLLILLLLHSTIFKGKERDFVDFIAFLSGLF